jgi:hypothetical protein
MSDQAYQNNYRFHYDNKCFKGEQLIFIQLQTDLPTVGDGIRATVSKRAVLHKLFAAFVLFLIMTGLTYDSTASGDGWAVVNQDRSGRCGSQVSVKEGQ